MLILCIIFMPSGARRCIKLLIVSNHVIFMARAPRMVSRLGRLRQLSNGFGVFPLSPAARHGPSARDCSRQRVRRYLSTLPSDCCCLSSRQRVRYCLFSRQRPHVCLCLLHFVWPPTVYRVCREPSPSLAPLPSTYCESELSVTAAATLLPMDCPSFAIDSTAAAPCI